MKDISVMGIDTAKNTFEVCGKTKSGRVVVRKKLSREKLMEFMVQQSPATVIAMEACGGSHHWGREFLNLGLTVRLIAPQFVKPYIKGNKNNRADAEAIAEAATRETMRFVAVKTIGQQDTLSMHRVRSRLVREHTALINEMRGLLHEYGVVIAKGAQKFCKEFLHVLEASKPKLSSKIVTILNDLWEELLYIDERIAKYDKDIETEVKSHPIAHKLMKEIPGIGTLTASALVASAPNPEQFKNGRQFAAWLGLVPRQHSTGDKQTLLGISKRGDVYLRTLLIHGARNVLHYAHKHSDNRSKWAVTLAKRRGKNKTTVAIANKNARIAWVLMRNPKAEFDPNHIPEKYKKVA